ncbi:hypothetical protein B6U99_07690 [Candidatus Geothermarchaeota archaeon ex4572_27]|nr:MAG: hypothetical protein B6U99_07690 [Candidatus Geothermarchaeota archaeon ex4572_27]
MRQICEMFGELSRLVEDKLREFEERLMSEVRGVRYGLFREPLAYAVEGGKRFRPLVLLFASEVLGRPQADPYPAAIAVEILHCESLIHDDIIDGEASRRGRRSFHLEFGPHVSLLSADFALGLTMDLLLRYKPSLSWLLAKELSRAVMEMCEGELLEVKLVERGANDRRSYLDVIKLKTAPLFRAAAKLGALIATGGRRGAVVRSLTRYGQLVGMAYQVRDDVMDMEEGEEKPLKLYPSGGLEALRRLARGLARRARRALEPLSDSPAKEVLMRLAEVAVERSY